MFVVFEASRGSGNAASGPGTRWFARLRWCQRGGNQQW